jgi:hypothetical protein
MLIQCIHAGHEIEIATVLPLGPTFRRRQVNVGPHVGYFLIKQILSCEPTCTSVLMTQQKSSPPTTWAHLSAKPRIREACVSIIQIF